MKRKTLTLLLAFSLTASLAACGSSGEDSKTISVEQTEPLESADEGEVSAAGEEESPGPDYDVEEQVILDSAGVRITAEGLSFNEHYGYLELGLTVENQTGKEIHIGLNSADLDVPFGSGTYAYLNGYQTDASVLIDVPSGETAEDVCTFHWDSLLEAGIEDIRDIELAFDISDPDYNKILSGSQALCALETTLPEDEADRELSDDLPLLLDSNGFQVYGKFIKADSENPQDKGHLLTVIRNNTAEAAQLRFENITLDGTRLTYDTNPDSGIGTDIGSYHYENPGHAVVSCESFARSDNLPEITDASVIHATLTAYGPDTGDYTGDPLILGPAVIPVSQ